MSFIEKIEEINIYENPIPHLHSRQAKFPGLVQLPSGEVIALFELGEAFDSADSHTYISRSQDLGRTWHLQGELYDMAQLPDELRVSEALKPALLKDGTLVATGYRFHRPAPETPIGNPETGGLLPGDNVISFSEDEGRSWSVPAVIEHNEIPELVETSGPCIQTSSGDLISIGTTFKLWDGENPSGQKGVVLRSKDKGKSWACSGVYYPEGDVAAFESRIIQMQPGKLAAIVWAFDTAANKNLPNHVVVSYDDGCTWSKPINTGINAQASNLMFLEGNKLLAIQSHRTADTGLYVRLVDFKDNNWNVLEEEIIWGNAKAQDGNRNLIDQFADLKFGQPSLLSLNNGDILATHWCVEDCMYKIKTHRLKMNIQESTLGN